MRRGLIAVLALGALSCGVDTSRAAHPDERVVVLGVDGMDPGLLRQLMDEGLVPNFGRLAHRGGLLPLETSVPPQSPVAWSEFITGTDAGTHGIFDFVSFDRQTLLPRLSHARVVPAARAPLSLGRWRIPLASAHTEQLRSGRAFWEILEEAGVPTTMFRVPVNYPPLPAGGRV